MTLLVFNPHNSRRMVSKFLPHLCSITIPGWDGVIYLFRINFKWTLYRNYLWLRTLQFAFLSCTKEKTYVWIWSWVRLDNFEHFRYKRGEPGDTRETEALHCVIPLMNWTIILKFLFFNRKFIFHFWSIFLSSYFWGHYF